MTVSSVDSLHTLSEKLQDEAFKLPSPPEGIRDWPVIGESAENLWQGATVNLEATVMKFQPQIIGFAKWLLKTFLGIAAGLVMFALAIIIAGILMASAKSGGLMAKSLFVRLAGDRGTDFAEISVKTVRSVVKGIIGVSIIQALLAGLGFAVAAFLDPEILVVDEVLAVGDAEFQKKAIGKMKEVSSGGGRTVLFVSHNMASINALCTSAVFMQNGSIKSIGETSAIIKEYLTDAQISSHYREFNYSHEKFELRSVEIKNINSKKRMATHRRNKT